MTAAELVRTLANYGFHIDHSQVVDVAIALGTCMGDDLLDGIFGDEDTQTDFRSVLAELGWTDEDTLKAFGPVLPDPEQMPLFITADVPVALNQAEAELFADDFAIGVATYKPAE